MTSLLLHIFAALLMAVGMFVAVVGAFRQEGKIFVYGFFTSALGVIFW